MSLILYTIVPKATYQKELRNLMKQHTTPYLHDKSPGAAIRYKIHKTGNLGCPVVSNSGTIRARISGFMTPVLRLYAPII